MAIVFHKATQEFHLYNDHISYIIKVLPNGQLGHLYFGKVIEDSESFDYMLQLRAVILAPGVYRGNLDFSLETLKLEYPAYGCGDFREAAYQIRQTNGSRITDFKYVDHKIFASKKVMDGMPATYGTEKDVTTLEITLYDELIDSKIVLSYSIFNDLKAIARSAKFYNHGDDTIYLERALSCSVDFYDADFDMIQLDGAWSRERHIHVRSVEHGIQAVNSTRGASSATHNPFIALKRKDATEKSGEVYGFSLVYSANFLAQVQVDGFDIARVSMGINPFEFEWVLDTNECFQTPEVILVYSDQGISNMSQTYHDLYRNHLMRGVWKDKTRPILINNWEATYFSFNEDSILEIATKAKDLGIELFVLDDGWFGQRHNDTTSLGDWQENLDKLPSGIEGLAKKINALGLEFGLWFEPEMVNEVSELYKNHPEWTISTPNRAMSFGRNQYVLDYANPVVVDYIYDAMYKVISSANISYIKWDMNRNITEAFSATLPAHRQKEFFHRYILGVYNLYERLIAAFPNILFESCASGGARFDPGMLYYAPQAWTSDDTDAIERLKIQSGTSMVYPLVSMGSHVSAIPNHQVDRKTSLKMRADVAYFGTFGYELDLTKMTEEEIVEVKAQVAFFKEHRELIQFGDFYRLENGERGMFSWMVVAKDKKSAIVSYYKVLATPNPSLKKIRLAGLENNKKYYCEQRDCVYGGSELMNYGLQCEVEFTGVIQGESFKGIYSPGNDCGDFTSFCYVLKQV